MLLPQWYLSTDQSWPCKCLGGTLQVGYCQGMAFVAGVILMYLPEEPAFRVLCQLLDEGGVGLRSLYLPGLCGLKEDLRMLDWLMERLMPELKQHLEVGPFCDM